MKPDKQPKKKKLRVRKKEKTKLAILTAAEEFFSKKPMDEVILEDIAEAAFVSRTTLYNYFKNKDDIYFGLGIQRFEEINDRFEENCPKDDQLGIDQILQLCELNLIDAVDRPLVNEIIRALFKRINGLNVNLKEWDLIITKHMRTPRYEKVLKESEEPYLIEFYVQLLRNNKLWSGVIKKGKSDGTISNNLKDVQIIQFIYMLMSGIVEEMKLRKPLLTNIKFSNEKIIENTLNLISSFLKQ